MANWNKSITVEVKLPYTTQGCTLDYLTAKIEILADSVWLVSDDGRWKSEQYYGDYRLLISGKAVPAGIDPKTLFFVCNTTTYKVTAFITHDGINNGNEQYRCRVASYE